MGGLGWKAVSWHFWRYTGCWWHGEVAAGVKCKVSEEQPFVVLLQGQEPGEQFGAAGAERALGVRPDE